MNLLQHASSTRSGMHLQHIFSPNEVNECINNLNPKQFIAESSPAPLRGYITIRPYYVLIFSLKNINCFFPDDSARQVASFST